MFQFLGGIVCTGFVLPCTLFWTGDFWHTKVCLNAIEMCLSRVFYRRTNVMLLDLLKNHEHKLLDLTFSSYSLLMHSSTFKCYLIYRLIIAIAFHLPTVTLCTLARLYYIYWLTAVKIGDVRFASFPLLDKYHLY